MERNKVLDEKNVTRGKWFGKQNERFDVSGHGASAGLGGGGVSPEGCQKREVLLPFPSPYSLVSLSL